MKKLICVLMTVCLMVGMSCAFAEELIIFGANTTSASEAPVEDRLRTMLPIFDSLVRNMGTDGETAYAPQDANFYWQQMCLIGTNFGADSEGAIIDEAADALYLPADIVKEYAYASFGSVLYEGEPADTDADITYNEELEDYVVPYDPAGEYDTYIAVERYATDADGNLLVGIAEYMNDETNERMGGLLVKLNTNVDALRTYPMQILSAVPETEDDFEGLTATACSIFLPKDGEEAQEIVEEDIEEDDEDEDEEETASYTALSKGSKGNAVKRLQSRLRELGYPCGKADGIYGSATTNAVRYFQDALGVTQNGKASAQLQSRLFASDAPEYVRYVTLKKGKTGIRVEKLQDRLRELGYLAEPMDGDYGERTRVAVKLFQECSGLSADGIAGTRTLKALESEDAEECPVYIDLQKGDTGSRVYEMQYRLIALKLLESDATGRYDSATVEAVRMFANVVNLAGIDYSGKTASAELIDAMFGYPIPEDEDPDDPFGPDEPEDPDDPDDPDEPYDPDDPDDPDEPYDPDDPDDPDEPYDPDDPDEPYDPVEPDEPYDPVEPDEPYDPDEPDDPVDPDPGDDSDDDSDDDPEGGWDEWGGDSEGGMDEWNDDDF